MKNGLIVDSFGDKRYFLNDLLHREDGPAIECPNGDKSWWKNGNLHREGDLPAIEYSDGDKFYYVHGELHRENGPARKFANGVKYFYLNNIKFSEKDYWEEIKKRKIIKQELVEKLGTIIKNIPKRDNEIILSKIEQDEIIKMLDLAWAIITNADSGNWDKDLDWNQAASEWRDRLFEWQRISPLYAGYIKSLKSKEKEEIMAIKKTKKSKKTIKSNLFTDANITCYDYFIPKWKKFGVKEMKIIADEEIDLSLFQHKKLKFAIIDENEIIEVSDESGTEEHFFPISLLKSIEKTVGPVIIDIEEIDDPDGSNPENFSNSQITFYENYIEITNEDYDHHLHISREHAVKIADLFSSWVKNQSLENFLNKDETEDETEDEIEKDPDDEDDDDDEDEDEDEDNDMSLEAVSERIKEGIV